MKDSDSVKLAMVSGQVSAVQDSFDKHEEQDNERFERIFTFVKERFDKTDAKLDTLWDNKNKQEGALGLGKWVAGLIGGAVATLLHMIVNTHGGNKP